MKLKKRILSILLPLCMCAGLLPGVPAWAADDISQPKEADSTLEEAQWVTGTAGTDPDYSNAQTGTLLEAFAAANSNSSDVTYIQLLKNVDSASCFALSNDAVLDLNGKTVSFIGTSTGFQPTTCDLTIKNGAITLEEDNSSSYVLYSVSAALTLEDCTITATNTSTNPIYGLYATYTPANNRARDITFSNCTISVSGDEGGATGIYLYSTNATLYLQGGSITAATNSSTNKAYGVNIGSAKKVNFNGSPKIDSTTADINRGSKQITLDDLSDGDHLPYTVTGNDGVFTVGAGQKGITAGNMSDYFIPALNNQEITTEGSGGDLELKLVTKVTITFDANGGEGTMDPQVVIKSVADSLKQNEFTCEGYTFTGWNTKANGTGTGYDDGANVTLTKDTTLYAQWERCLINIDGTVSVSGEATFGETLTASYTGNAGSTISYQWYRGDEPILDATGNAYTLTADDIGKQIKVVVAGTDDYTGTVESNPTSAIGKGSQTAPGAGEGYSLDYGEETITVDSGYEVSTRNDGSGETITTGDLSNYFGQTIYIRKAETDTQEPSGWTAISVAARPTSPAAPTAGQVTSDSFTVAGSSTTLEYIVVKQGQTPGAEDWVGGNGGNLAFSGLNSDTEYVIYARVPSTDTAPASLPSAGTPVTTLTPPGAVKVSGRVTDASGNGVGQVTVTLKQGSTVIKSSVTDGQGNYSFSGVSAGVYNIVAAKDDATMTILMTVAEEDLKEQNIEMPNSTAGIVNSVVQVDSSAPDIVAGGVEGVAEKQIPASGETITVTLAIRKENDTDIQEAVDAAIPAGSADDVLYLDLSLTKTTTQSGSNPTTERITDTNNTVLEIIVPYDFKGKDSVMVYRKHGNEAAQALTAVSSRPATPTDGTFWADRNGSKIHIYATKFSTYAIAYSVQSSTGGSSGGGGSSGSVTYPPVIEAGEHGDVTVSPSRPKRGAEVTITAKPDDGYEVETVAVTDLSGKQVEVEQNRDGTWSFIQPSGKATIKVTFREIDSIADCPRDNTCPMAKFTDMNMTAWYHDGVHYCLDNGLMVGTGAAEFSPDSATTRGQFVTIIWRQAGSPVVNYLMDFSDVDPAAYYGEAVRWAVSEGIVSGYGNGLYGPNDCLTREQLAVMLYHYAQNQGYDVSVGEDTNILSYTDFSQISEYAIPALQWACGAGIVNGYNSALSPQGQATRAQTATMLLQFCESQN